MTDEELEKKLEDIYRILATFDKESKRQRKEIFLLQRSFEQYKQLIGLRLEKLEKVVL